MNGEKYTLMCWAYCSIGKDEPKNFENWLLQNYGLECYYIDEFYPYLFDRYGEILPLPDNENERRIDVLFSIRTEQLKTQNFRIFRRDIFFIYPLKVLLDYTEAERMIPHEIKQYICA